MSSGINQRLVVSFANIGGGTQEIAFGQAWGNTGKDHILIAYWIRGIFREELTQEQIDVANAAGRVFAAARGLEFEEVSAGRAHSYEELKAVYEDMKAAGKFASAKDVERWAYGHLGLDSWARATAERLRPIGHMF